MDRLPLFVAARNFGDIPIPQALEKVAQAGFDGVDNFDWRVPEIFEAYLQGLERHGLAAGVLVINKKPDVNALGCSLNQPGEREGFLREVELCIRAARRAKCNRLEVLSGNAVPGVSRAEQMECCVETLRAAAPILEEKGMTAVIEMLNTTVDHPGYFLGDIDEAARLIERVNSPCVKLLFDVYHVQIAHGNVIERMRDMVDRIGQIHFADVPGRHEPGTGELNFRNIFRAIFDLQDRYPGYVTAEYHPTDFTFKDLTVIRELASFRNEEQHDVIQT